MLHADRRRPLSGRGRRGRGRDHERRHHAAVGHRRPLRALRLGPRQVRLGSAAPDRRRAREARSASRSSPPRRRRRRRRTLLAQHQEMLRGAGREREEILQKALKEAEQLRTDLVGKARAEAEQIVARAREQIAREKDQAIAELRAQVADIAVEAASRIVKSSLTEDAQRKLVDDYIPRSRAPSRRGAHERDREDLQGAPQALQQGQRHRRAHLLLLPRRRREVDGPHHEGEVRGPARGRPTTPTASSRARPSCSSTSGTASTSSARRTSSPARSRATTRCCSRTSSPPSRSPEPALLGLGFHRHRVAQRQRGDLAARGELRRGSPGASRRRGRCRPGCRPPA